MLQNQTKLFSEISSSISELGTKQQSEISSSLITIEKRISELQQSNQQSLFVLTTSIQNQTKDSLQNVIDTTKKELILLQELTTKQLELISSTNSEKLTSIQKDIERKLNENLEQNLKSFESVSKNLTQMQSTATKMIDSTQSIDKLNSIFERTSSKAFGDFGEKYLESLLEQHLYSGTWSKQTTLAGASDRIDFVISIGQHTIGIDCKFPVTKYQDYINAPAETKKQHYKAFIDAIKLMSTDMSQKYYKTNTLDSLLLYLPSDGMYAEAVNDESLLKHLAKSKVTITSPATLFPLIIILNEYQFKQKVNEHAQEIIDGLRVVKQGVKNFREEFRKLGDKMRQAQNNYDTADKSLFQVTSTVERLEHSPTDESQIQLLS